MANIIVYGGTFSGVAAAAKAAANAAANHNVYVIVPDVSGKLGGVGTAGGQNYMDLRDWNNEIVTRGTLAWWRSQLGRFYSPAAMSQLMENNLNNYGARIIRKYGYDITNITFASAPDRIANITIRKIKRGSSGFIEWDGTATETISGAVFIDASDDGRLTRLANFNGTAGRCDWNANCLDADELGSTGKARQQAATLMFKVTGVNTSGGTGYDITVTEDKNSADVTIGIGVDAGNDNYANNLTVKNFNNLYGPQGYMLKPLNGAKDGINSNEWWLNALLVFNVDGRAYERDFGTSRFPTDMRSDYITVDQAWVNARNFLGDATTGAAFLNALRQYPGFGNVNFVLDSSGKPVVGDVLYLRETIHSAIGQLPNPNSSEDTNYALTTNEALNAGTNQNNGSDLGNYATRIGLNFYWSDINAYKYQDLKDASGKYIWFDEVSRKLRPEIYNYYGKTSPENPVFVPYKSIITDYCANLLISGYACGVSAYAWSETRVLPNLTVLGDAAGVAAAYAVNNSVHPVYFTLTHIEAVQQTLINAGAMLDKQVNESL